MFLTIVLWSIAVLCCIGVGLVVAPFRVAIHFSNESGAAGGAIDVSFGHPALIRASMDLATRALTMRLFGRVFRRKAASPTASDGGDDSDAGYDARNSIPEPPAAETSSASVAPSADATVKLSPPADASVHSASPAPRHNPEPAPEEPPAGIPAPPLEETVAGREKKTDNWLVRLRRNRYVFFVSNPSWRGKVLRWLLRVVRSFLHMVTFDRFAVSVRAGLEDPMLTGTITGLHRAVCGAFVLRQPFAVRFEPVFMRNCFEGSGTIGLRTSMAQLLMPLVVAIATFPTLHTAILWWQHHRLEKQRGTARNSQ